MKRASITRLAQKLDSLGATQRGRSTLLGGHTQAEGEDDWAGLASTGLVY